MSTILVYAAYAISAALALGLLYFYHARWYWHVLSVCVALAIGFSPPIPGWDGAARDLVYGFVVLFLLLWGVGEPFAHRFHRHREPRHA